MTRNEIRFRRGFEMGVREKITVERVREFESDFRNYLDRHVISQPNPLSFDWQGEECGACVGAHLCRFFCEDYHNGDRKWDADPKSSYPEEYSETIAEHLEAEGRWDDHQVEVEVANELQHNLNCGDYDDDIEWEGEEGCEEATNIDEIFNTYHGEVRSHVLESMFKEGPMKDDVTSENVYWFEDGVMSLNRAFALPGNFCNRDFDTVMTHWMIHRIKEGVFDPWGARAWPTKDHAKEIADCLLIYKEWFLNYSTYPTQVRLDDFVMGVIREKYKVEGL